MATVKVSIPLSTALQRAHTVLQQLHVRPVVADACRSAVGYENGREHGLRITLVRDGDYENAITVFWAEYRASDRLVLYIVHGVAEHVDERAYNIREMYDTETKLAKRISEVLEAAYSTSGFPAEGTTR